MTIKQNGGVFGRNPTFNDVTVEGDFSANGSITIPDDSISGNTISGGTAELNGLTINGQATITTNDNASQLTLISTDTDANVGPQLTLWRNSGTGTNGDLIGEILFLGEDTIGVTTFFAAISGVADQTNNGAEDGSLRFKTLINNNLAERLVVNSAGNVEVSTGNLIIGTSGKGIDFSATSSGMIWKTGSGSPEGVLSASVGSLYTRSDGGAGTTLYVKESGTGNTGWVAK